MTVTYSNAVSTSRMSTFAKLLFRWRGSIYKLLWRETALFLSVYFLLSVCYRYAMNTRQREVFEKISEYCEKYTQYVPLTFILGFYVSIVFGRWWQQFTTISWPDKLALLVATYVHGADERGRMIRRTIMRYVNLTSIMGLRLNSSAILKRFPSMGHLVESGFITEKEVVELESVPFPYQKSWVPCQWASGLLTMAKSEGRIESDYVLMELVNEVAKFMGSVRMLTYYDWISVPLVYTQVVTLAVYTFFVAAVMGRQYVQDGHHFDLYFPFFTTSQLLFYLGWLKVAEVMINPFGEDDDDFEVNFIIERNWKISLAYVDGNFNRVPPLEKDLYWDSKDINIPHTAASYNLKGDEPVPSTEAIKVAPREAEIVVGSTQNLAAQSRKASMDSYHHHSTFLRQNITGATGLMLSRQTSKDSRVLNSTLPGQPGTSRQVGPNMLNRLLSYTSQRSRTKSINSGFLITRPISNSYQSIDATSQIIDNDDEPLTDEEQLTITANYLLNQHPHYPFHLQHMHHKLSSAQTAWRKSASIGSPARKISSSAASEADWSSRHMLNTVDETMNDSSESQANTPTSTEPPPNEMQQSNVGPTTNEAQPIQEEPRLVPTNNKCLESALMV